MRIKASMMGGLLGVALVSVGLSACSRGERASASGIGLSEASNPTATTTLPAKTDSELRERLTALCTTAKGDIGVAVIHVESGRMFDVAGAKQLPLYSVYKLPLAITVLKRVEEKQVSLDQRVWVTPSDVAPGSQFNADLWRQPAAKTVAELLEFSIVRSDNTSSDKLLELVGGPRIVTAQMYAYGFNNIDIKYSSREFAAHREKPNLGTAVDLAMLLAKLQQGGLLQPPQVSLLLGLMDRARTGGERRLRANLPAGTEVAEKTGTGENTANDVGLITLPDGKGHLAIAVLINGSKLATADQEKLIAEIARTAYDAYLSVPAAELH